MAYNDIDEIRCFPVRTQIVMLKGNLDASDYMVMKRAEGCLADAEFSEIKARRQRWRDRINELETGGE